MKNKIYSFLFLTVGLFFLFNTQVKASHAAGAELRYDWISGSTYKFTYTFYRSCEPGAITEPASVTLCYHNTCGGTGNLTMQKSGGVNGVDVSPGCPGYPTECSGGTTPGYKEWKYSGTVTLPSQCNYWTFFVSISARNSSIVNLNAPGGAALYVEATLDNLNAQGNSSPFFTVKPIGYMCVNSPFIFNNGAVDPNNDSLSYELIMPLDGGGSCTTPSSPCTFATGGTLPVFNLTNNPIGCNNTFSLSATTGALTLTPSLLGKQVLTIRVNEWKNGMKIGSIIRDMQWVIMPCSSNPPNLVPDSTTLTGVQLVNGQVQGCAGQPFNFCFNINSPTNPTAVLVATANNAAIATGSSLVFTGNGSANIQGCFTWNPTMADTGLTVLNVTVKDSTCTPPGILLSNTFTIPLFVWGPTKGGPDTAICSIDSIQLWAHGGLTYQWDVLPGGAPLSSLSCTNCANPWASPSVSTQYVVTSTSGNTLCFTHSDTVTVDVLPPPNFNLGPDITTCNGDSAHLNINLIPAPNTSYSINWFPSTFLSNDTIANPWVKPLHDTTYVVTVIPGGVGQCGGRDTLFVNVLQGFTLFNSDTAICKGQTVQIQAIGETAYTYKWSPTIGINNPNIINPGISPDTSRMYVIKASYPGCSDSIAKIYIDVQPNPTVYVGVDRILCMGDTVHLKSIVTPSSYPFYSYTWTPAGGLNSQNTPNPIFTALQTTNLVLTVKTPAKCNGSDQVKFTVINATFMQLSSDTAICPRDSAHIRANGNTISSIAWSPDYYLYNANTKTPVAFPVTTTTYTVIAVDTNNCKDTAYLTVEVKPDAVLTLPDSVRLYPGDSYQMDPGGNGLYFQWFPPLGLSETNISNPIATPNVNTRYFVQTSTEAGCTAVDSIDVYVSYDSDLGVPNAFTPGAGPNGLIKINHLGNANLVAFTIFNRWGQKVFETANLNDGWDGNFNGKAQPMGVYVYTVEAVSPNGRRFTKQGNITLIR